MLIETFSQWNAQSLDERIINIGWKPDAKQLRQRYAPEIIDILRTSYAPAPLNGYGGHPSGSAAETVALTADVQESQIKITLRDGRVSSVFLYKPKHGRKSIAAGTDGTRQGKKDLHHMISSDAKLQRAWGEVSERMEALKLKYGFPMIPNTEAERLTGKTDIVPGDDGVHYTRSIGGTPHEKVIVGWPK